MGEVTAFDSTDFQLLKKETASDVLSKVKDIVTKLELEFPDSGLDRVHRRG